VYWLCCCSGFHCLRRGNVARGLGLKLRVIRERLVAWIPENIGPRLCYQNAESGEAFAVLDILLRERRGEAKLL
jgi:hypothetical protein